MRQRSFFDDEHEADQRRKRLGFWTATDADLAKLSQQKQSVLQFIHNHWRSTKEIVQATGATEALRRIRELRQDGYDIKKQGSGRQWSYLWTGRKHGEAQESARAS